MLPDFVTEGTSAPRARPAASNSASGDGARRRAALIVAGALVAAASFALTVSAMRTTSTTFDEILLPAAGARGLETGRFDLVVEQPPLMEYLYGIPIYLSRPAYPAETGRTWGVADRYEYAQDLFWKSGNDPERLAFLARLVSALIALGLVVSVLGLTAARHGPVAGVVAGTLAAFLPDLLAHGGVTWNDLPAALAVFWAVWGLDRAVRRPGVVSGAVAGALIGLALGVKFSAVALAPVALVLVALEWAGRRRDRTWRRNVLLCADVALAVCYLVLVVLYRGDFALLELRQGLMFQVGHAALGHGSVLSFLGHRSRTGWWYFFPVAFLLKTPAALHVLLAVAVVVLIGDAARNGPRAAFTSPLRSEVTAIAVLGAVLLGADLEIGFRYALPVLPFVLVIVGAGAARAWERGGRAVRGGLMAACAAYVFSVVACYPDFLAYTSEYVPRGRASQLIVDSSLDWGQGLLRLRKFLVSRNVDRVYLAYFGSALPDGYGIESVPPARLLSDASSAGAAASLPPYFVVSATFLAGAYLDGDPYAPLRSVRPVAVLGRSLVVFGTGEALQALRSAGRRPKVSERTGTAIARAW